MQGRQGQIGGRRNRVAARDYYEHPTFVTAAAPPDKPGLLHCPACDRAGLAPTALICPDCGHDFTHAWRALQRRLRNRRGATMVALTAGAITAAHLYDDSARLLGDWVLYALAVMWCGVAVIWAQYYWLHMRA
ncbi:MAG: hypothetical protein ABL934_09800 [Lysobacteraceae bacterium]